MAIKKKDITPEAAQEKMAALCSRSEQCEFDINRKLINLGISGSKRQEIISWLKDQRFLDNARFAECFARDKARFNQWGPYKIKAALSVRKICAKDIQNALDLIDEEIWEESLIKAAKSKARTLDLTHPAEEGYENRKKLFRFLISRGFTGEQANRAVKEMKRLQQATE